MHPNAALIDAAESSLLTDDFPLALDVVGACIAATALVPLSEMSELVRSPGLKKAWLALTFVVLCGIVLLLLSVAAKVGRPLDAGDAAAGALHILGPTFALTTAWLSRRSAQDMLRIEALKEAAFVDHLTGLANRRCFDERLPDEVRRARASGFPLSLIMLDMDHFKQVNDTYGHGVGDLVLKKVATLIATMSRDLDTACRIGGEEFIVIMPGLGIASAGAAAERLRLAVAEIRMVLDDGEGLKLTVSIGFVTLRPYETADLLFRRADDALYEAKRDGRNRVNFMA